MKQQLSQLLRLPTIAGQPTIEIKGPFPTLTNSPDQTRFESLGSVITAALTYLLPLAGLLLFLFLVFSGFQLLLSAGEPKKIEAAKARLTYAVLGFFLLLVSYWVVKVVEQIISPNQPFF